MTLAVVKPDHIGDLVLSSAAIRCALARRPGTVLFVASANLGLSRVLFPGADIRGIDFPHLSKLHGAHAGYPDLRSFEHVMFLRADGLINPAWANLRCQSYSFPLDHHEIHQSMIDYGVAAVMLGGYDVDALHFGAGLGEIERKARGAPRSVGLCIGSGFHANLWPAAHWVGLGRALRERGLAVRVICGPAEAGMGVALAEALGLGAEGLIRGGGDLGGFLDRVGALDRVVASDGGAAHLCSLRVPMVSIFGPSPFRRYAPYGRFNRLLTRDLSCSPCCQWASTLVNGCLSNECITAITPADVLNALRPPHDIAREGHGTVLRTGLSLYEGVSHLSHAARVRERELQRGGHALLPVMEAEADGGGAHGGGGGGAFAAGGVQGADVVAAAADGADADGGGSRRRRRGTASAAGAEAVAADAEAGPDEPGGGPVPDEPGVSLTPPARRGRRRG